MAESQRDLTLVPGFDLSEIAKSAARVQGILDSMSGDFTKFDEKTIAVLDNVSRAMKDLKATMQSLSMTIQASMSESTNSLDINALKSNIDAIKQNMESLMTAFQNVGDTSGLAESIKAQLNQIRADISQATADIISQFAGLVDKINGIAKGININLNSPLKGKQFEELQRVIELVQKPVVTSWDVTSMVSGLDAISERINAINPDLLQRYADLANAALQMPEIIPPVGGNAKIPGVDADGTTGGIGKDAIDLTNELNELLAGAEFRTKTITQDVETGRKTLVGILSDGRVLTRVEDDHGNVLKATLRTTKEIQINATERLNQLKAATAELDRQRVAYEKIAKSPYASDAEKQSALAGLENARTALQELMGGFDAAMTDVLGSSLDKALEQARTKLATSFTSVEDTLSSVAVKQVDASLKKIESAYSQLEKLYATPVQDTAQSDARETERLKLLQLIRDEEAKINQAVQDTTISLTAQEHAQKAVAEAEKLKSDHQAARNIQNQEWAYIKAAEALDKQRSIQSEIDKLELKIANSRDKDTAYIEKQLAEERSRLVVQQELYEALVKRFNLDENSSRLSTRLVALDQQRVDAENALAEAQDRAVQSAAADASKATQQSIKDNLSVIQNGYKQLSTLQDQVILGQVSENQKNEETIALLRSMIEARRELVRIANDTSLSDTDRGAARDALVSANTSRQEYKDDSALVKEEQMYAQIVDWMKQQRDLQKEIYDLQVKYIETGSQDQSLMDRIDARQRELNALTDIINKNIEENGILLDTKQIQDETARSIEVQRQGEEALATARQKAATADTTKRYQEATRNLQQQITLQKKIGDLEAKSVRSSDTMKVTYQQRIVALKTELQALEQSYNQINQTNMSEEQRLAIQALIKQKEDEIEDAQLRVKAAVDQTNTSASSMQSALGNIVTGMQRSIGGMIAAIPMRVIYSQIRNIVNGIKESIQYCTDFYDKMNEIRTITGMTVDEVDQVGARVRQMASEMSTSSLSMADAAITFYRQGLGQEEVEKRMKATTEFANAASMDFNEAAEYITSASNALGIDAEKVADVFLYLGDTAGTSGAEIGLAMSRAAATSQAVGVEFESLGAMIAVVSEKTRQDAGSIGTALQSIMTRLANVKAKGFNEEDETKVNDVAKALNSVNIALTDGAGNWRSMDTIFMDIAKQWDSLNDKQRAYLATTMAGTRQQNVFRTLMDDMAKMNSELDESSRYAELLNGALNSEGTAEKKAAIWEESFKAARARVSAEWEELISHFDITPLLIDLNNAFASLLDTINDVLNPDSDLTPYEKALKDLHELTEGSNTSFRYQQPIYDNERNVAEVRTVGLLEDVNSMDDFEALLERIESVKSYINEHLSDPFFDLSKYDAFTNAIYSMFYRDNAFSDNIYSKWESEARQVVQDVVDGVTSGVTGAASTAQGKVADAASAVGEQIEGEMLSITEGQIDEAFQAKVAASAKEISKEAVETYRAVFQAAVNEAFDGSALHAPSISDKLTKRLLAWWFGGDDGKFTNADQYEGIVDDYKEKIEEYIADWKTLSLSVEKAYSDPNESLLLFRDMRKRINAFNEKYNTNYTSISLYDIIFPNDEKELHAREARRQAVLDEQAKAIEEYYKEIAEGHAAAVLEVKKSGGFAEEVVELGTQLQGVKDTKTLDDQKKAIESLNAYYQDMRSTNKDLYDAMTKEFSAYWFTMMDALTKGDLKAAWAAYEQIVVASNEKAKKAMTDNEQAVQKWNDTVTQGVIKADVDAAKKSGFAEWVSEYTEKLKTAREQFGQFEGMRPSDMYAGYDALTSEWDKMSTTEEGRQWQSAFASFFGNDFYVLIDAIKNRNVKVIEETWAAIVKKSEEGAEKAETEWEKFVQKQKESTEKETLQAEKYGSWLTKMYEYMDAADAAGLFEWWSSQSEALREDFYQLYPALQPLLSALADDGNKNTFIETWAAQFADLRNNLPTKTDIEQIKKLNAESEKFVRAEELRQSKKNKYSAERETLWSYFDGNSYRQQLKALSNGNVDLTSRPVISVNDLGKAGWTDENGKPLTGDEIATMYSETFGNINAPFALTATPILPNGDVLSPKTFYEYIDELMAFDDVEKMLAYDKDHHNIVANWIAVPKDIDADGIDEFLTKYSEVGQKIHELHDEIYGAGAANQTAPDLDGFYAQILKWQEDGTLDALYSGIEGLELLVSQLLVDMKDGTLDNVDLITKLNDLLFGTTTAWQRMGQAAKEALDNDVTDIEGVTIGRNLLQAYDQHGMEGYRAAFMALSDAEQDYVEKQFEDHNKMLAGYEEEAEAIENIREAVERLNATQAENDGTAYAGTANWMKAATDGKGFFKQLENASKAATELYDGWEGLAILSGKLTDNTEILEQAMEQLSDATGLSVETLQGPNGLQQAEAVLMGQTNQAQYTIEMFGQALADAGYIRPDWGPVMSQLRTLAADTSTVQGRVAQFILAWNEASKLGDITLALDVLGNFTAIGGGILTGLEGTNAVLKGIKPVFDLGQTKAQTSASTSSRRSGGGGGGSSKDTSNDNLKTEIEKMIHLMEQLQELYDFEQSLIQAQRKDFEQDRLIQDQIATYRQESKAIEANNAVLQANIDKIEALLPGQQALVDSMSTTDEKYKEASADLEKLQSTHQKYTKQLMENRTTIKEYAEAVDDLYDKIRDMEIDLRDTILEAIKDREALEESMRDARIAMEDELFDLIKKRYERERDLIIDNATKKRDALKEEQNLLDENLAKRKAAAEQEDKQAELLKLQQKLIRISADPTRRADQLALQKQIKELQDELAWDEADREVEAQKESLDKQIMNLDDYIDYVKQYYEDLFEHPQKLLSEVEALMSKTDAEIIAWLKANNDEFGKSTETAQTKMVEGWESTLMQMRGDIVTYWDEVESIIQQGDDAIIEFLKTNSAKYREASQFQAEAYVDGWKEQLEDLRLAYLRTYEEISAYDYSTIRLDESSSSSSSSSSGSGGNRSKTDTKPKDNPVNYNPTTKEITGTLHPGATPTVTYSIGQGLKEISTGTQYYDPWSRQYVDTSGARGTGDGASKQSSTGNFFSSGSTLSYSNTSGSSAGVKSSVPKVNIKPVIQFGSGGETGNGEGLAYLHSKERVLNPYETKLFDTLVESLHRMERLSFPSMSLSSIQPEVVNNQPTFGDIVINVDSLSEDTDYDEVADKIMEVISDRMNFGRAVGGVTRPR